MPRRLVPGSRWLVDEHLVDLRHVVATEDGAGQAGAGLDGAVGGERRMVLRGVLHLTDDAAQHAVAPGHHPTGDHVVVGSAQLGQRGGVDQTLDRTEPVGK